MFYFTNHPSERGGRTQGLLRAAVACHARIIPRQKLIDATLLVTVDDGGERRCQIGQRIDGIEFAGLDKRGNGRPVLGPGIVSGKECILAIEGNRPNGALDTVAIDLDATVAQEELQAIP
ncbi:hypothetical protein AGR1C_pTi0122 [Agrobacterium fabacearum TT111]|nr:hypothetical protein AGR1C_pTi0122 [Agrobacterium fabacearum TT111]